MKRPSPRGDPARGYDAALREHAEFLRKVEGFHKYAGERAGGRPADNRGVPEGLGRSTTRSWKTGGSAAPCGPERRMNGIVGIARALDFAARRHAGQRRKGLKAEPYVNHLTEVALLLAEATDGADPALVMAGLLHDTIEDTDTTPRGAGRGFRG